MVYTIERIKLVGLSFSALSVIKLHETLYSLMFNFVLMEQNTESFLVKLTQWTGKQWI